MLSTDALLRSLFYELCYTYYKITPLLVRKPYLVSDFKHPTTKVQTGRACSDARFLNLDSSWRWVVNFKFRLLYSGKNTRHSLNIRLSGPPSRSDVNTAYAILLQSKYIGTNNILLVFAEFWVFKLIITSSFHVYLFQRTFHLDYKNFHYIHNLNAFLAVRKLPTVFLTGIIARRFILFSTSKFDLDKSVSDSSVAVFRTLRSLLFLTSAFSQKTIRYTHTQRHTMLIKSHLLQPSPLPLFQQRTIFLCFWSPSDKK